MARSDSFLNWASDVGKLLFNYNPPTKERITTNTVAGAGGAALATLIINKIKHKKTKTRNLVLSAIAGGLGGAGFSYYRSFMDGKPFDNSQFDISKLKPGDKVYLGIGGSSNGEGESWFGDEMRGQLPRGHVKMFRHVDLKDLEDTYNALHEKGITPIIVGHSSGGKHAAKFLEKHPDTKGYLLDPVSWFGKTHPNNATAFTVDKRTRHGLPVENYIADAGGRWNLNDAGTYIHTGSHSDTMPKIIRDFISKGYDRDNVPSVLPNYITGRIWDPK